MREADRKINLFNRQRKLSIDIPALRQFLSELASHLEVESSFSVVLLRDDRMRQCNRRFAGKDYATDVLSFPTEDMDRLVDDNLGDILISVDSAYRQARGSLLEELKILSLHGLLHLMGYDHETDGGEMEGLEARLRRELHLI